jgi:hypothetical protein
VREVLGVYYGVDDWIVEFALVEEDDVPTMAQVEIARVPIFRFPAGVEISDVLAWPQPFRRYLAQRGVTLWQARRWRLAFALEGRLAGRVVVPTRSSSGRLLSYTARAVDRRAPVRYLTPAQEEGADTGAVFGEEHWGPGGGTVVVAEGSFDALAIERVVRGVAIAVLGTGGVGHATDPRVVDKLRRFDAFVIATDADTAGDRAYAVISSVLTDRRVVRARPPEGFDANEMEPSALRALVEAAL